MPVACLFCSRDVTNDLREAFPQAETEPNANSYFCARCGVVILHPDTRFHFDQSDLTLSDIGAISIVLRNDWERGDGKLKANPKKLTIDDLIQLAGLVNRLDPLEKMDNALLNLNRQAQNIGEVITIDFTKDYPYYYCRDQNELLAIMDMLMSDGMIAHPDSVLGKYRVKITAYGYRRLREIQRPNQESDQCFVAMWFAKEMATVYEDVIRPAIEFTEPGKSGTRFKAVKIDNVEHFNDINDEIIAQIRRSRFMVCDLTGYRGGVYFEAGFAFGLGLPVIYTCRNDWTESETLKDADGNKVRELFDRNGKPIRVGKEGVHFDLSHRNRIQWDPENLDDFKEKLEQRIKATIY